MKRASSSRKSVSDVKRLAALKDSEIVVDDDAPAWTPEMFARAVVKRGLRPAPRRLCSPCALILTLLHGSEHRGAATNRV